VDAQLGPAAVADRLTRDHSSARRRCCYAACHTLAAFFSAPPRVRGLRAEAVELGDERRRALKTVLVAHRLMVP
jgi:hypothetical protein